MIRTPGERDEETGRRGGGGVDFDSKAEEANNLTSLEMFWNVF